jgi:TetR/AcrR family transcriptional regulator, transcriptional repressor for nem operon
VAEWKRRKDQSDRAEMKKTSETKEKLLQVAFDLIWDSSYGSVSVDDICKRAGINKGSFYHFFKSKADLAMQSHEEHWKEKRPEMDRIFSSQVPPLERLRNWCIYIVDVQKEKAERYGHVCGCPYASVGMEVATQDEKIRCKSEYLMDCGRKYVESAIADAMREGSVTVTDPVTASQRVYSVCTGMLVEAKVKNNLEMLRDLEPTIMGLLGAKAVRA